MDLPTFRREYDQLTSLEDRTRLLLGFAEEAMQRFPDELQPLLEASRAACQTAGWDGLAAGCDRLLGWIVFDRADFSGALDRFQAALSAFEAAGDGEGRLKALNGVASVYGSLGRYETSLEVYRQALDLAAQLGDQTQTLILQANIGETLAELGHHSEAIGYYQAALDGGQLSPLNAALILAERGHAAQKMDRLAEARLDLERAVSLAREGGFQATLALALGRLGALELTQGNPDRAERLLHESRDTAQKVGDRTTGVQTALDLGSLHASRGAWEAAIEAWDGALVLARELGARRLETDSWGRKVAAFKALGRWKEALEAHEQYHSLSRILLDESVTRQLAELKADQGRRENELLRDQTRTLALLGDLGQKITASLDLETVVLTVYGAIGDLMKTDTLGLGLYDPVREVIDYRLAIEGGVRLKPFEGPAAGDSISAWVLRHRKAVLIGDFEGEYRNYVPQRPPSFGNPDRHSRSGMFVPLLAEGRILGILSVQSYQLRAYSDRDLEALRTLGASISVAVENARLFEKVNRLATIDSLTGAATRRYLFDRAEEEFQRFLRDGVPLALIMVDLDHFKELNDSWGHQVGDQVLADFGALCLAQKRPHDLFGRYGGEEFALILAGSTLEGALATAHRLCQGVRDLDLRSADGQPIRLTASFGVTVFDPNDREIIRVFGRADEALYRAKTTGRDRVEVLVL
jgi:diguanylate cyclase (GGDEF)-like protein